MTITDVSHPFAMIGFISGICLGIILYNALRLSNMKWRTAKLETARDLILEGHSRKIGASCEAVDTDFIKKQVKKNEAKLGKNTSKKVVKAKKKEEEKPEITEADIMDHYSSAFVLLDDAEEILSAADFSFDPDIMLDDGIRKSIAAFSAKKAEKSGKNKNNKKDQKENEKKIRERARKKAKKEAENISLFDEKESSK